MGAHNVAVSHNNGKGVERNKKRAKYFYELAAMGGDVDARYRLGLLEECSGKMNRAMKHWMIAAGAGHDKSLEEAQLLHLNGHATKDVSRRFRILTKKPKMI